MLIKRSPVVFLAGNVARFDATPIKIYEMLRGIAGSLENPLLISFASLRLFFDSAADRQARNQFREIGVRYKVIPRIFPVSLLILLFLVIRYKVRLMHTNNHTAAIHGLLVKKILGIRLIFDYHGAIPEEMVERGRWRPNGLRFRVAKYLERKAIIHSDKMFFISRACKDHFQELKPGGNSIVVIPCGIRTERFYYDRSIREKIRRELGIGERMVITYNGTFAPWAMAGTMITFFMEVKKISPLALFLIISPTDQALISGQMIAAGVKREDLLIRNLPHDHVGPLLMAGDLGILFRSRSFINHVASPMKFAEYLSCGVPVIATPGIGDTAGYIQDFQTGFIFDPGNPAGIEKMIRAVRDSREDLAFRCSNLAKQEFDLTRFDNLYLNAYAELLDESDAVMK